MPLRRQAKHRTKQGYALMLHLKPCPLLIARLLTHCSFYSWQVVAPLALSRHQPLLSAESLTMRIAAVWPHPSATASATACSTATAAACSTAALTAVIITAHPACPASTDDSAATAARIHHSVAPCSMTAPTAAMAARSVRAYWSASRKAVGPPAGVPVVSRRGYWLAPSRT